MRQCRTGCSQDQSGGLTMRSTTISRGRSSSFMSVPVRNALCMRSTLNLPRKKKRLDPIRGRTANRVEHHLLLLNGTGHSLVAGLVFLLLQLVGLQMLSKRGLVKHSIVAILVCCHCSNVFHLCLSSDLSRHRISHFLVV